MYYVIGVDLGNLGDRSAVSVVEYTKPYFKCVHLQVWQPGTSHKQVLTDTVTIAEHILQQGPKPHPNEIRRRYSNSVYVVVDTTVAGNAIGDEFEANLPGVRTYTATVTAGTQVGRYGRALRVPKRDLASTMRVLLDNKYFTYATQLEHASTLRDELKLFDLKNTSGNDNEIDWRVRPHDDLVLATALACWLPENGVREAKIVSSRSMGFSPDRRIVQPRDL